VVSTVRRAIVLLVLLASPSLAWTTAGHMVSASIAFDVLKQDDPAALARVLDALRQRPQYAERFADKLDAVPAEERDSCLRHAGPASGRRWYVRRREVEASRRS
jgi:hypothetical protein